MTAGPVALVGSGEFLPGMQGVDAALLEGRQRRVAVIPTAAGREGDDVVAKWLRMAYDHYRALDADVVPIDVRDRDGALDPGTAAAVAGCGLVYFSGGDPHHLTACLTGTPLWAAVHARWLEGTALAGCSAGAMALGERVVAPPWRARPDWIDGLGVVGGVAVIPHFDRFTRGPGRTLVRWGVRPPDGTRVIGIDEDTALVHADGRWTVAGAGGAWEVRRDAVAELDLTTVPAPDLG